MVVIAQFENAESVVCVEWSDKDDYDLTGMTVSEADDVTASLVFPFVQSLTIFHRRGMTTKNCAND